MDLFVTQYKWFYFELGIRPLWKNSENKNKNESLDKQKESRVEYEDDS